MMDQRKLIQHGKSSLTMAIPSKWISKHGLKKGDSVYVKPEGNKVIISAGKGVDIGKISVDVTKLDRTSIYLYIQSLYRFGYDEIEVTSAKSTAKHHRRGKEARLGAIANMIVNRCIGMEIIDQEEKRIVFKHILKEQQEDFKIILRRALLLMNECALTLLEGIVEKNKGKLDSVEDYHDNINKFINYCLRLLNKYGYPDVKKTSMYFHIIASIDKIVDIFKYNARPIIKYNKPFSPITIKIWEQVNKSVRAYYDLFFNFDLQIVNALSENRDNVKNMIEQASDTIPSKELLFLNNMKQVLELLLDLTEFRMGLEY